MISPKIGAGTILKIILYTAITVVVPGGAAFGGYQVYRLIKTYKDQKRQANDAKITPELQGTTGIT